MNSALAILRVQGVVRDVALLIICHEQTLSDLVYSCHKFLFVWFQGIEPFQIMFGPVYKLHENVSFCIKITACCRCYICVFVTLLAHYVLQTCLDVEKVTHIMTDVFYLPANDSQRSDHLLVEQHDHTYIITIIQPPLYTLIT